MPGLQISKKVIFGTSATQTWSAPTEMPSKSSWGAAASVRFQNVTAPEISKVSLLGSSQPMSSLIYSSNSSKSLSTPAAFSPSIRSFCFSYPSARPETARPRHDSFSPADSTHSAHLALYHVVFSPPIGNFVFPILARGPKAARPLPAARSGTLGRLRAVARGSKQHARSMIFFLRLAPRPSPT